MRAVAALTILMAVASCGPSASGSGDAAAQGDAGGGQGAYVEACIERYTAQSPQASAWAPDQCAQDWQRVAASDALAAAILESAAGNLPPGDRLGADLSVTVDRSAQTATWSWSETGGLIPYDAVGALEQRGATVAMIGCSQIGTGEFTKVYGVTPAGASAFQLSIYERSAPTANAESFYNVTTHPAGRLPTRVELARDGSEWTETCAY